MTAKTQYQVAKCRKCGKLFRYALEYRGQATVCNLCDLTEYQREADERHRRYEEAMAIAFTPEERRELTDAHIEQIWGMGKLTERQLELIKREEEMWKKQNLNQS